MILPADLAPPIRQVVELFERFAPGDIAQLGKYYCEAAHFKDPFNAVQGVPAIERIFEHMFERLEAPRFEVIAAFGDAQQAMLTWNFRFRLRNRWLQRPGDPDACIHGATHFLFAPDGRVREHRDYWDAAQEFYETMPAIGWVLRSLRHLASATG
jgi:hypothetical protein